MRALLGGLAVTIRAALIRTDLYQIHDPELLLWSWLLRLKGTPVVYDMHEHVASTIMTRPWIPERVRPFLRAYWSAVERVTLSWCAVVFAETSYAKHYPWVKRFTIVLNLPDLDTLLKVESSGYEADLVYVGRVAESRGSMMVLKALEILRRSSREVSYVCVGEASSAHTDELHRAISQMGLNAVQLLGYRRPKDAWAIAKGCRVGLAVLMPEPNYTESYPTKMFEYMALGLPVIASNFPLYREVVDRHQCGLSIDPASPESIASAIADLLEDPEKAKEMGANGRRAALAHYDWQPQLDNLEALYASCGVRARPSDPAVDSSRVL